MLQYFVLCVYVLLYVSVSFCVLSVSVCLRACFIVCVYVFVFGCVCVSLSLSLFSFSFTEIKRFEGKIPSGNANMMQKWRAEKWISVCFSLENNCYY